MATALKGKEKIIIERPVMITGPERLRIWQKAQRVWKNRTNVDKELKKMRREWDRKLPKFSGFPI